MNDFSNWLMIYFWEFLFDFLHTKPVLKKGSTLKGKNLLPFLHTKPLLKRALLHTKPPPPTHPRPSQPNTSMKRVYFKRKKCRHTIPLLKSGILLKETNCSLSVTPILHWKGIYFQRKEFAPERIKICPSRVDPFWIVVYFKRKEFAPKGGANSFRLK